MTKRAGGTLKSGRRAYSIWIGRKRGHYAGGRSALWLIIVAMAAIGLLSSAVAAQTEPEEAGPDEAVPIETPIAEVSVSCAGTTAVGDSTTSAELIEDCETLLAALEALESDGERLNWSTDTAMRNWTGIRLNNARTRVDRIDLPYRDLEGSLPPGLGDLTGPTYIRLSFNGLTGPIPPELGNLTTLRQLFLDNNELNGVDTSGVEQPQRADPSATGSKRPDRVDTARAQVLIETLRALRLGFNRLSGCIPTALHERPSFDSEPSTAVGIPLCAPAVCSKTAAVAKSTTDVRLIMDCDALLEAKSVLDPDKELNWSTKVAMGDWDGVGIVEGAYGPRVDSLDLTFHFLTGTVPAELSQLSALSSLDLSHNLLTGTIPAELGNLSRLEVLNLHNNLLTETIPAELSNLVSLKTLVLSNNSLSGAIPPELGDLSHLTALVLSDNLLTGSIPPELGQLSRLTRLDLNDNRLTGTIPPDLGEFTELELLFLNNNRLTGTIPRELGRLSRLTRLDLDFNRLAGAIPVDLGKLESLRVLHLSNNLMTGPIWRVLGELTALEVVLVGGNELTGCVPPGLIEDTRNDFDTLELPTCENAVENE